MPIYEYRCECGKEGEVILPLAESDQSQVCECGKVMQRKVSLPRFVMKQYAKDMALNTLNAPKGRGMPKRSWTPFAEQKAFEGIQGKATAA